MKEGMFEESMDHGCKEWMWALKGYLVFTASIWRIRQSRVGKTTLSVNGDADNDNTIYSLSVMPLGKGSCRLQTQNEK